MEIFLRALHVVGSICGLVICAMFVNILLKGRNIQRGMVIYTLIITVLFNIALLLVGLGVAGWE